jgi:hypothetical protein
MGMITFGRLDHLVVLSKPHYRRRERSRAMDKNESFRVHSRNYTRKGEGMSEGHQETSRLLIVHVKRIMDLDGPRPLATGIRVLSRRQGPLSSVATAQSGSANSVKHKPDLKNRGVIRIFRASAAHRMNRITPRAN